MRLRHVCIGAHTKSDRLVEFDKATTELYGDISLTGNTGVIVDAVRGAAGDGRELAGTGAKFLGLLAALIGAETCQLGAARAAVHALVVAAGHWVVVCRAGSIRLGAAVRLGPTCG